MSEIRCNNCLRPYPDHGVPFICSTCGGYYDFEEIQFLPPTPSNETWNQGIWRYRRTFNLPDDAPVITLGEGMTPLVWSTLFDKEVAFKVESSNPTGSYKDRGSAVLASFLCFRGVKSAVEDSSGNAGASFAAYATRSGIQASIYVPSSASGTKVTQIQAYGGKLVQIPGSRSETAAAVRQAAENGAYYASHAFLPQGLYGYATLAYEIFEQLGCAPGTLIAPVGQGNLLLAIGRGFQALQKSGLLDHMPALVGVQARVCAPLWAVFHYGPSGFGWVTEDSSLAEGVIVRYPVRGDGLIKMIEQTGGTVIAVDEEDILRGRNQLARIGLYVEPTSALVWSALLQGKNIFKEPIVSVLTGSGLKVSN